MGKTFQTGGLTNVIFYDTSGNVAINDTTASGYKLKVNGTLGVTGAATFSSSVTAASALLSATTSYTFYQINNTAGTVYIGTDNSAGAVFGQGNYSMNIYQGYSGDMNFFTTAALRMKITSSGNVGIGTSSPSQVLDIVGTFRTRRPADTTQYIDVYSSGGEGFIDAVNSAAGTSQALIFRNGNSGGTTERMRITSGGVINIGTTAQATSKQIQFQLDGSTNYFGVLNNSTNNDYIIINGGNGSSYTTGATIALIGANRYGTNMGGQLELSAGNSSADTNFGYIGFNTSNTSRMRITSAGKVLIGTTSVISTNYAVQASSLGGFVTNASNAGDASFYSTTGTIGWHFYAEGGGSTRMYVLQNGDVRNANNSYGAISDISLKENIIDATPKLADLLKVKVRNYNFIADEKKEKQIGVIAQELEEIFPNMISEDNQMGSNETIKTVKYSVFVPMLIKAIQEQQEIINNLSAKVTALENK